MILLGHGAGGRMTDRLIRDLFTPRIGSPQLAEGGDSALLGDTAFTIDGFTVTPQDFPGGDIGRLAVCGTVNDLAMVGARPVALSAAFMIEEGLDEESLERWADSMGAAARGLSVPIVACDTKVVERGSADRIYIATAGLGLVERGAIRASGSRPEDLILVSGPVGDHGAAVMTCREGLGLESPSLLSDCAPLWPCVDALLGGGVEIHAMRDPTRGGLAQCLNELARSAGVRFEIDQDCIPVRPEVDAVCGLTGMDPLSMACEGRFVAVIPPADADRAMGLLMGVCGCSAAAVIGRVAHGRGDVVLRTAIGASRMLPMPAGELLPRIC
jgi:hydrogenase expression/formation protein HypE